MPSSIRCRILLGRLQAACGLVLLGCTGTALGATVTIPLQLGPGFFRQQVIKQIFADSDQTFVAWNDGSGCNHLVMSDPTASSSPSGIRVKVQGEGRTGSPVGELCIPLVPWTGFVEVLMAPSLIPHTNRVSLEVIDSSMFNAQGKADLSGTIWNWAKQHVHPRLASIEIDFDNLLNDLRVVAPLLFSHADANQVREILSTLHISGISTSDQGLSVMLGMNVTEVSREQVGGVEPALSSAELSRLEALLKQWDAFVTLVAKQAAMSANDSEIRDELLTVLLVSRHEIIESLTRETSTPQDPVRRLFLDTWTRLSPILRRISVQMPNESALNFIAFIGAVDALEAIDTAGPSLNLDISTDGLLRLVRLITPGETNPLFYDEAVDPQLRRLFDFGEPIQAPVTGTPPSSSLDWFLGSAHAQSSLDRSTLFKLNNWIPTPENIHSYLVRVQRLLEDVVYKVLRDKPLQNSFTEIFHPLMLAAAWQETCWRQFIEDKGEKVPIRSPVGAVGIMQVSPRVWRGFYHPNRAELETSTTTLPRAEKFSIIIWSTTPSARKNTRQPTTFTILREPLILRTTAVRVT